jgi:L-ascorbate metabolism protein UlaG (beta-lactamase superfamily)
VITQSAPLLILYDRRMRITKFTHSCVRLEDAGRVLVIDPGVWGEAGALLGTQAVLVTHEHVDHIDTLRLAGAGVPVFVPEGADLPELARVRPFDIVRVSPGDEFEAAGFRVRAVGGQHAVVYGDRASCVNLGYVVEETVYHPGDSLHVPDADVETLFVPLQASWLKTAEAIDFVRAVGPRRTVPIHEGQVNERGLDMLNHHLAANTANGYRYLRPRESL